jgi:hypothetical protein
MRIRKHITLYQELNILKLYKFEVDLLINGNLQISIVLLEILRGRLKESGNVGKR